MWISEVNPDSSPAGSGRRIATRCQREATSDYLLGKHQEQHHTKVVLQKFWEQESVQKACFGWVGGKYVEEVFGVARVHLIPTVVTPEAELDNSILSSC